MKKIISFSLYGNKPNFQIGAVVNTMEARRIYPGWTCRFYTTDDELICRQLEYLGAEVVRMHDWPEGGMFWRFLAVDDADFCLSRDCDSVVTEREAVAVNEWMEGDYQWHAMHDHKAHRRFSMMGGMWGYRHYEETNRPEKRAQESAYFFDFRSKSIKTHMDEWLVENKNRTTVGRDWDQLFLGDSIYQGKAQTNIMWHGGWANNAGRPFPPHPDVRYGSFVGSYVFKEKPDMNPQKKKIIVSVLAGGSDHYERMERAARDTCFKDSPDNISVYYVHNYRDGIDLKEGEQKLLDDCFYYGEPAGRKNLLRKCIEFWGYCLENFEFDYIFRPNLGCWVSLDLLNFHANKLPSEKVYAGNLNSHRGVNYISGAGFLLSRDVVQLIWDHHKNDKEQKIEYDGDKLIDDMAIGSFLNSFDPPIPQTRLPRELLHKQDINEAAIKAQCHHYYFMHPKDPDCYYLMRQAIQNSNEENVGFPDKSLVKEEGVFEKIDRHELSFSQIRDVYLGSADPTIISEKTKREIRNCVIRDSNIFASCGGFFSLNVLDCLSDLPLDSVTFFDVNPYSVDMCRYVVELIKTCGTISSFLERYLMVHIQRSDENYLILPTSEKHRKNILDRNTWLHNDTSFNIFHAISKSPYSKDRVYLLGFMNVGGDRVGELLLKSRKDNSYIYQNTLGVGDGWLSSDESFVRMKKFLNSTKLNFLTADINSIECHPCDTVIASNISQFKRVSSKSNLIHANNKGHYAQSRFLSYKGKPKNKKVVYTVIAGGCDDLKQPEIINDDWDYVCFTDVENVQPEGGVWQLRPIPKEYDYEDKKRTASLLKIEFYNIFGNEYELVFYLDATTKIKCDLNNLVERHLFKNCDMAAIKHRERDCIYDEAEYVKKRGWVKPEKIDAQVSEYKNQKYPNNNGLICGGFLIRKNNLVMRKVCEIWSREYTSGCRRDQIGLAYSFWKASQSGYEATVCLMDFKDVHSSPDFEYICHKKNYQVGL